MAGGCFTQVMLHSSKRYHQEHVSAMPATSNAIVAAWGAVIIRSAGLPIYIRSKL
jgi:hypothetical protein